MAKIFINKEGMNDLKSRLYSIANRVSSLENDIARSLNRLDWEVSQKELIRGQILNARKKTSVLANQSNQMRMFIEKALNDFSSTDSKIVSKQKESLGLLDSICKILVNIPSRIYNGLNQKSIELIQSISKINDIFLHRDSSIKITNLDAIKKGFQITPIIIGGILGGIAPFVLSELLKSRIQCIPNVSNSSTQPKLAKNITPLSGILSYNPKVYSKEVELMQKRLNELGYKGADGKPLAVDGKFGKNTLYAVNNFKNNNKLGNTGPYNGKVGPDTWGKINSPGAKRPDDPASGSKVDNTSQQNNKGTGKTKIKENDKYNMNDTTTWHAVTPKYVYESGNRTKETYNKLINQYNVESNPRYKPRNGNTYCNIFAWDVSVAMGAELPRFVEVNEVGNHEDATGNALGRTAAGQKVYSDDATATELNANRLAIWLNAQGENYGWREISAEEAQERANKGLMTISVIDESPKVGHVQVIRPTPDGSDYNSNKGVYLAQAGSSNSNGIFFLEKYKDKSYYNRYKFYTHD